MIRVDDLKLIETRKIIQRGPSSLSLLLPKKFFEDNELYRGSIVKTACSADKVALYIFVGEEPIKFTTECLEPDKKYNIGVHVLKRINRFGDESSHWYPIVTIPQIWAYANGVKPSTKVKIYQTPQKNCLVLKKE